LDEIREQINKIDKKILAELEKRFKLTTKVGQIKADLMAPVFVPERETELILELEKQASEDVKGLVSPVFKTIIRLSRRNQYSSVYKKLRTTELGEQLESVVSRIADLNAGKRPCLEVAFREYEEVNSFFNIVNDYGFYPLEFSLKSKSGLVCRSVVTPLEVSEHTEKTEEMFIKMMYQLCNEFNDVRIVGWV